ncbi:hypothetical protein E3N88_32575 [Mikania micrantha]|uniref:Uncharacterized protein n=1 Tax=Mikania micrantha TaxID=192012 RepID=A0A5N6M8S2_9ASTR|nr:hypothetical protein E3N88_32575 [Mikania micrantha]
MECSEGTLGWEGLGSGLVMSFGTINWLGNMGTPFDGWGLGWFIPVAVHGPFEYLCEPSCNLIVLIHGMTGGTMSCLSWIARSFLFGGLKEIQAGEMAEFASGVKGIALNMDSSSLLITSWLVITLAWYTLELIFLFLSCYC